MATSSILEDITVNNPRAIEEFLDAMEKSANAPLTERQTMKTHYTTDPAVIRDIVSKGIQNRGKN